MTQTKKMRGTCPACFREMDVDDGRMHRHGWVESGDRRVGEYGRAWHSGPCFGTGWAPFEVSPEGTWAFLEKVVFPEALNLDNALRHYKSRPTLTMRYEWSTGERLGYGRGMRKEHRSVELEPGATVTVETGVNVLGRPCRPRTFEYEVEIAGRIDETERRLGYTKQDGLKLFELAEGWKPGKLKEKDAGRVAIVHLSGWGERKLPMCNRKSRGPVTDDEEKVTCSRCQKYVEKAKVERAQKEAEKVDAETLVTLLREKGPLPQKTIKKLLGWDTKRFNRAKDREWRGEDRISQVYTKGSKPNEYEVRAPRKGARA